MGAGHSHGHHHGHHGHSHGHHGSADGRLLLAFCLNFGFALIELVGGILTNSVAITSDAVHDFGDAMAIGVALALERFSRKRSDAAFSYGYRRYSTMAAVITGAVLVMGSLFILVEAVPRLVNPQKPHTEGMLLLAVLGLAVNGFAAWRVSRGTSLSEKMVMWHLMEDVLGWVLVLIGALIMTFFDLPQIDAALGIMLALWILFNVSKNLREALRVFLQGVPAHLDVPHLLEHLRKIPGVRDVHHVHVWSLDGEQHIFTGHLIVDARLSVMEGEAIKKQVKELLTAHEIFEATLEIEPEGAECVDPSHS